MITPAQFKRIRKHTKLSQHKIGMVLGVTPQSIYAWEKGKANITPMAEKLIRFSFPQEFEKMEKAEKIG